MTSSTALTIRPATSADLTALRDLAQLDSQRLRDTDHVIAEADGTIVAAVAADGTTYADPFVHSAGAVAILRAHVAASRPRRRRSFIPRPALAA